VQEFAADRVTTSVVLPEGSTDVSVLPTTAKTELSDTKTFSYLDTFIGRPTKVITVRHVSKNSEAIRVQYRLNRLFALLEPALLIGSIALLFLVSIISSRVDLTIAKDALWVKRQVSLFLTPAPSPRFVTSA
jgi:oligosaccharyltransferase complex subunit alpha (ribophorin I)